uniref:C-type lectin domain-containing protein n=1 Tax=Percolomonas cosmopolitus TaxID=63605 RepID=A0A7S1PJB7_9EUKA|mmetsp:Transcript_6089/g.23058  ORF Transcript_6089/g.23058 Transcript_6089/m.23058 type:complete len:478 (+) Transcript_6089:1332-2765(+)|eukprot:CAMPEP_0117444432 /NCGR_PEP_ID=MMETSP0759-20121206/5238_1 /TAXON_ID=63605 /ORGANISM="Percolomonas cosmopolitus, Strain WS" /LENGTH=477 /DNA_ID=CAMNT_0005236499 /DNA_START=517 /DNA_END=1950 /DNA_ORIENTATION=-
MKPITLLIASLLITLGLYNSVHAADLHVVTHKDDKFSTLEHNLSGGVQLRDRNKHKRHKEKHRNKKDKGAKSIFDLLKCWFHKKDDTSDVATYEGYEYQYFGAKRTWKNAEKACEVWGGHLASVNSRAEHNFVKGLTSKWSWIGLTNENSRSWSWSDGSSLSFSKWFIFEPNNWGRNEHCGTANFIARGYWHDFNCHLRLGYICKRNTNQCSWGNSVPEAPAPNVFSESTDNKIVITVEMAQKSSSNVKYAIGFEDYDPEDICEENAASCLNEHLIELGPTLYKQENVCEEVFEVQLSMEDFIDVAEPSMDALSSGGNILRSRLYMVYFDGDQVTKFYTDIEFHSEISAEVFDVESILSSPSVDSVGLDASGRLSIDLFLSSLDVNMWLSTFRFISSSTGLPYRIIANEIGCSGDHLNCGYQVVVSSRQPTSDFTDELTFGFQYHLGSLSTMDSTFKVRVSYNVKDRTEIDHTPMKV